MLILVNCTLREYLENKDLSIGEDRVVFNIEEVMGNVEEALRQKSINPGKVKCVTVKGFEGSDDVFKEVTLRDLENFEGVVGQNTLCRLPDGFSDMFIIDTLSKKNPSIRFIGGNLLELPGLKVGRYDEGKEKLGAVYDGIYDTFLEIPIKDIDKIDEVKSRLNPQMLQDISDIKEKVKKKQRVGAGNSTDAPKKEKAIVKSFLNLLSGEEVDF